MKTIVIGNQGMLGRDLQSRLQNAGYNVKGIDIDELDITQPEAILPLFEPYGADLVINCAAYTAVDADVKAVSEACRRLPQWADHGGYGVTRESCHTMSLRRADQEIRVTFEAARISHFVNSAKTPSRHAFSKVGNSNPSSLGSPTAQATGHLPRATRA